MNRFVSKRSGATVVLGQEIARGGEGAIHTVEGSSDLLAKVYLKPLNPHKAAKVSAMTSAADTAPAKVAAWPIDVISDQRGEVRGFLMPRVTSGENAHELYSPKGRAAAFPEAGLPFIVHVAANIARAFDTIHGAGHVIGDINHGHILVAPDGRVTVIDADSFQVTINGQRFTCDVGSPLFTPPELQNTPFRGLVRTREHDLFGLAVIMFHLLFLGRHPYAGKFQGKGEMPIERAIQERRFAYGRNAASVAMISPPHTVPLSTFGPSIESLFERAFSAAMSPTRPTAAAWASELQNLQQSLRTCSLSPAHHYPKTLQQCPWCPIEDQTGVRLFGQKIVAGAGGAIDVASLWATIERIPAPLPEAPLPSQQPWEPPEGLEYGAELKNTRKAGSVLLSIFGVAACSGAPAAVANADQGIFVWAAIALFFLSFLIWPRVSAEATAKADRELASARAQWSSALDRWNREASTQAFHSSKQALQKTKVSLEQLPQERARRMAKLRTEQELFQLQRFLDRFRIDRAKLKGIGSGRKATLASFGVETAYDVTTAKISSIPGFGEALTAELVGWAIGLQRQFRFNPNEPIDPKEIQRVETEIAALRQNLIQEIRKGAAELTRLSREIPLARQRMTPALKRVWDDLKIAELRKQSL